MLFDVDPQLCKQIQQLSKLEEFKHLLSEYLDTLKFHFFDQNKLTQGALDAFLSLHDAYCERWRLMCEADLSPPPQSSSKRSRKGNYMGQSRRNFSKEAVAALRAYAAAHKMDPYPNEHEKESLVSTTGLTYDQISNWFINYRMREWRPKVRASRASAKQQRTQASRTAQRAKAQQCAERSRFDNEALSSPQS